MIIPLKLLIIFLTVTIEIVVIFYQHRNTSLLRKYSVKDVETAKKISDGSFSSLKEYQDGLKVGAINKSQLDLVKRYEVKTYSLANEIHNSGFPDHTSLLEAKELGAENIYQFNKIKKFNLQTYEEVLQFEKGNFSTIKSYLEAKELNITNYGDLILFKKYNSIDRDYCKSNHLAEISSLINNLPEKFRKWRYSDIYNQALDNIITKILLAKDIFTNNLIYRQLNRNNLI